MIRLFSPLLLCLLLSTSAFADSLSLHLFRSPYGISWKNPWKMTVSTLKNSLVKYKDKRVFSISHVFVEVNCESTGEHIFRGQTSIPDSNERELIFKEKYGMGVMFHTYPGVYEKNATIIKDMAPYETSFRKATASFKISPSSCQRMLRYADEYEALGYFNMYAGLQGDPLKREGSGCSAFGVSFLRVTGILGDFAQEWKEIINVPKRFIGGPLTGQKVNITKILAHPFAPWSSKRPSIHLEAWNPERMHTWVGNLYDKVEAHDYHGPYHVEIDKNGDAKTVEVDMSHIPTPVGTFWL